MTADEVLRRPHVGQPARVERHAENARPHERIRLEDAKADHCYDASQRQPCKILHQQSLAFGPGHPAVQRWQHLDTGGEDQQTS